MNKEVLVLLGNGPSLKGFDFKRLEGMDTIGMNAAYRYWDRIEWYPTYYICLDTIVIKSHSGEINRLIQQSDTYGIRKFFLRKEILDDFPNLKNHAKVCFYEDLKDKDVVFDCVHVTTGSFAARFGIYEKYRKIAMLGIDETYVNFIKESVKKEGITLEIGETPNENPNYFFTDYQQKGDLYQIANHSKVYTCNCRHCKGEIRNGETLHVDAWDFVAKDLTYHKILDKYGEVQIVNCNFESNVKVLPFKTFQDVKDGKSFKQILSSNIQVALTLDKSSITNVYTFDGSTAAEEHDSKKITSALDALKDFTIRIWLNPRYNSNSFMEKSNAAPPMAFIIGAFALYDLGPKLEIAAKTGDSYQTLGFVDNELDWMELSISYIDAKKTIQLFQNGNHIVSKKVNQLNYRNKAITGKGFLNRFWKGEIGNIYIENEVYTDDLLPPLKQENVKMSINNKADFLSTFKLVKSKI